MLFNVQKPGSLWPEDGESVEEFDPFDHQLPGDSVTQRLRHLFLWVVTRNSKKEWRQPDSDKIMIFALKSLYAAMVGFKKENLMLLYPSGQLGNTVDELLLTKVQQVEAGPSVRDRCCGHVFKKGETYYRCRYVVLPTAYSNVDNVVRISRW
jgi:hypothetical protein